MDDIAKQLVSRVSEKLPGIIQQLLQKDFDPEGESLQLECSLTTQDNSNAPLANQKRYRVATIRIGQSPPPDPSRTLHKTITSQKSPSTRSQNVSSIPLKKSPPNGADNVDKRPFKRRKAIGGLRVGKSNHRDDVEDDSNRVVRRLESDVRTFPQRKKPVSFTNPVLQPSSFDKFVIGVWESLFSSVKMNPVEVIEQWQAIELNGRPRLLTDTDQEIIEYGHNGVFGRMNVLTRKISQTSRTFRSLEVIVQAHWVQCFDDRVAELGETMTKEKSKKTAIAEACVDFSWTEKELRNKMAIWKGYHDIQKAGGWAALVFAGMGLYRFCKYRVSFTEEAFHALRALRHRFEVVADTLHTGWRDLLQIIEISSERKYFGHPHQWVVCAPGNEALPLPDTYRQWDEDFSYTHLDQSELDEDVWGEYDPRTVYPPGDPKSYMCQVCNERQSDQPALNSCACFPNLYGSLRGVVPVQVFRTPNGRNNGLLACCPFERGAAVGEFVGLVTSGINGLDVMVGQTERASYQIWQGREGNYTRFVNHSCQPNSQFERFVWLGKQRIVLVSRGIEAGDEITVDYSDTYWRNLDKKCLCEKASCRYRSRVKVSQLLRPPEEGT